MKLKMYKPVNLIRLAKFFAKSTDKILAANFKVGEQEIKVPMEFL